jgi:hypothetical protein
MLFERASERASERVRASLVGVNGREQCSTPAGASHSQARPHAIHWNPLPGLPGPPAPALGSVWIREFHTCSLILSRGDHNF